MKIEKGYTLSQFVDYVQTEDAALTFSENNVNYMFPEHQSRLIIDWNGFLKKPLTKDMFINPVLHPDKCHKREYYIDDISYEMDYAVWNEVWQEAEKKVIFKVDETDIDSDGFGYLTLSTGHQLNIDKGKISMFGDEFETIGQLFDYLDGNIELQNVEL